jgi:putative SOS response-associated peptidase YedK
MCGRYTAAKDFGELIRLVGVVVVRVRFFAPCYNIAPTQMVSVIYRERHPPSSNFGGAGQPAVKLMRWGLIPSWAKDESTGNALINARSGTIESWKAFRVAFKHRRWAGKWLAWARVHADRSEPLENGFVDSEKRRLSGGQNLEEQ